MRHQQRPLRVVTEYGAVQGVLKTSPIMRLLDDLNVVGRHFITVHEPVGVSGEWPEDGRPLCVNRQSILFVEELEPPPRPSALMAGELARFTRAAIRLRVGSYSVEGLVHVPPGGNAMARLYQDSRPFLAMTSVTVSGPRTEVKLPFLAVHRGHILAAQHLETPAAGEKVEKVAAAAAAPSGSA